MDVKEFNEYIIQFDSPKDISVIKDFLKRNIESNEVYNLCRELYLMIYNGVIRDNEGKPALSIPDEKIQMLANNIKTVLDLIDKSKGSATVLCQLLEVLRGHYMKTATKQEIKSRIYVEKKDGLVSTLYDLNFMADWEGFVKRLLSMM